MREILFRGRRVDNGEWETGSLIVERMNTSDQQVMIADKMTGYPTLVIPETVGQYTGLKDKKGTRIFEDDIVKFDGYPEFYSYVCFENFAFMCKSKVYKQYGYHISNESGHKLEVIGNIFDNPELLEGKT